MSEPMPTPPDNEPSFPSFAEHAAKAKREKAENPARQRKPVEAPGRPLEPIWIVKALEGIRAAVDATAGQDGGKECHRLIDHLIAEVKKSEVSLIRYDVRYGKEPGPLKATQGKKDPPKPPTADGMHYMPFGKYKGQLVHEIARVHPDYLIWLISDPRRVSPGLRRHIRDELDRVFSR